jgi:MarR family transcriptional regulator for hemolysin
MRHLSIADEPLPRTLAISSHAYYFYGMKKERANLEAFYVQRLPPVTRRLRMMVSQALAELGLSHATGWVFLQVARSGGEIRQADLANAVDMNGSGLVRLIDNLESQGLLERRVDATDRRSNRIAVTEAGHVMVERIEQVLLDVRPGLLAQVSTADLEAANRVLVQLDENILSWLAAR